jgi:hypothetical protein
LWETTDLTGQKRNTAKPTMVLEYNDITVEMTHHVWYYVHVSTNGELWGACKKNASMYFHKWLQCYVPHKVNFSQDNKPMTWMTFTRAST